MRVDIYNAQKKYDVIYADPPWNYKQHGSKTKKRGMAEKHYSTMTTEEICNLPIKNVKSDIAVLFLWATFPNIFEAQKVIEAWGFEYKTAAFVWVKKNKKAGTNFWGMGSYTRANAEPCLIAISKNTKAGKMVERHDIHQIIEAAALKHSAKPPETRDKIVALMGGQLSKIELFARDYADGWDCWGNEV